MTQTVQMVWAKLQTVRENMSDLREKEKELIGQLTGMVPEGGVVDGVRHVVIVKDTISYAKAVKKALDSLGPKGRGILNDAVVLSTKTQTIHKIQEAAQK